MYKCIQLLYYILDVADLMLTLILDTDNVERLLDCCREHTTWFSNVTGLTGKTLPVYETINIASLVSRAFPSHLLILQAITNTVVGNLGNEVKKYFRVAPTYCSLMLVWCCP